MAYATRRIAIAGLPATPATFIAQPLGCPAAPRGNLLPLALGGKDAVFQSLPPAFGTGVSAVADIDNDLSHRRHVTRELQVVEHVTAEPVHLVSEEAVNLPDLVGSEPRTETGAFPDRHGARDVHVHVHEDHGVVVILGIVCDPCPLACGVRR